MRYAVAAVNTILGTVYTSYGIMTLIDLQRGWSERGFSHFGAAWVAMAFTCGPHHLEHGLHGFAGPRQGAWLDLMAVLVGVPAGVTWFLLRVEAFRGGRGDRFVGGTPTWVSAIPAASAVYVVALAMLSIPILVNHSLRFSAVIVPNLLLVWLYVTIGYWLTRTQLRSRKQTQGWSVSGVALAIVFPTCALMHAVYALYRSAGLYATDAGVLPIDVLAVPAAAYFLWVVRGLYRNSLRDWNAQPSDVAVLAG